MEFLLLCLGIGRCACHVFRSATTSGISFKLQSTQPKYQHYGCKSARRWADQFLLSFAFTGFQPTRSSQQSTSSSSATGKVKYFIFIVFDIEFCAVKKIFKVIMVIGLLELTLKKRKLHLKELEPIFSKVLLR